MRLARTQGRALTARDFWLGIIVIGIGMFLMSGGGYAISDGFADWVRGDSMTPTERIQYEAEVTERLIHSQQIEREQAMGIVSWTVSPDKAS